MRIALIGSELEENLALRYIHAAVTRAGHEAAIFDFHAAEQAPRVVQDVLRFGPQAVGLSMVFTARAREFLALAAGLRQAGCGAHITAGGHFASFHAEELLRAFPALDSVLHGEGEEAMVDLAAHIDRPADVAGITCRAEDGDCPRSPVVTTPMRELMDDLDRKAWPSRPSVFDQYLGVPITNILASRGCYGDCSFCSINAWHRKVGGRRFRQRSLEDLTAEMADLYHRRGVRIFNFHDDNFFLPTADANLARFGEWRDRLKAAGVGRIAMQVKARPDSIEERVIGILKELGLFRVFLGVESNAVAGLKALGRGIRREQNHKALAILREADLHVTYNLLMFEPDCSPSDLRDNIDFIRQHEDVPQNFCGVVVYSGTALERRLREQGRLEGDFFGYYYRIADDRCQRAYEVFRRVFTPRNFLLGGMNLQGMAVDYNLHILKHFFPRAAGAGITRRAKDFLRRLNGNNADLLEETLDFAEKGGPAAHSDVEMAAFAERMSRRREAFDRKLARQCEAVLARMRALAEREASRKGSLVRRASAAAAAAVLVMGGNYACDPAPSDAHACTPQAAPVLGTHATELVAPWPSDANGVSIDPNVFSELLPKITSQPASASTQATQPATKPATQPTSKPATQPTAKPAPPVKPPQPIKLPTHETEMAPAPPPVQFQTSAAATINEIPGPVAPLAAGGPPTHPTEMPPMPPPPPPKPPPTAPAKPPASAPASRPASGPTQPTTQGTTLPTPQAAEPFSEQETQDIQKYLQKQYGAKLQELATKQNAVGLAEVPVYLELDARGEVRKVRVDLPNEEHAKFKARVELDIIASWTVPNPPRAGSCTVRLPIAKPPPKTHIFEMAPRD